MSVISLVERTSVSACRESVLELLRETIARAEAGEVVAIGIVEVTPDSAVRFCKSKSDNVNVLVGGISRLLHRINTEMDPK